MKLQPFQGKCQASHHPADIHVYANKAGWSAGQIFNNSFPISVVSSHFYWLNPLRMIGMAFLFTGITVALYVIIRTLGMQSKMLAGLVQKAG